MKFTIIIISVILFANILFSFGLLLSTFYQSDDDNSSKFSTIFSLYSGKIKHTDDDFKKILDILKTDNNLKNKFIMSYDSSYSYYTNSNFIFTDFSEGMKDDTVEDFITKKNWSYFDRWLSSTNSIPAQSIDSINIPDYLIYRFSHTVVDPSATWYDQQSFHIHSLLSNPNTKNLPEFLNVVYFSNSTKGGIVVYEINLST
ncbi:hypothetical protein [Nitrosopumilus sp. b2]|uniref:hypothetical protein n=1 Tax=Nitrosopumilus sp. b2 TaxID=2109908 RepID=UPI0015F67E1E|nr:hypothetical protein [Nitrosopumilus sp. b2]KAF6245765.1 hypothetical protein C6989_01105 [Nitrosopumilus sp. b2]